MMKWTRAGLEADGFDGFVRFADLQRTEVPAVPGVYLIVRQRGGAPEFLSSSPAGRFKGKDPSVTRERLEAEWVAGTDVVYIGKALVVRVADADCASASTSSGALARASR